MEKIGTIGESKFMAGSLEKLLLAAGLAASADQTTATPPKVVDQTQPVAQPDDSNPRVDTLFIGDNPDGVINKLTRKVAHDMGIDINAHPVKANLTRASNAVPAEMGVIGKGKNTQRFLNYNPDILGQLSYQDALAVIAHELRHGEKPKIIGTMKGEYDSDKAAAKTYGAEKAVHMLESLGKILPNNYKPDPAGVHPTIPEREQAILKAFPHQHVDIVPAPPPTPNMPSDKDKTRDH